MLRIGEFSKLSHTTVKALRFYEKEGLLVPSTIDKWTGYRYYQTSQLQTVAKIKSFRQIGLSIDQIKDVFSGKDVKTILQLKADSLQQQAQDITLKLSIIKHILEEKEMKYQVTVKELPEMIVYYSETVLNNYSDIMQWIPSLGQECLALNPTIKCAKVPYEFCEYLDGQYKKTNVKVRHNEAVDRFGNENDNIKFRKLAPVKVLSIYHKGAYDNIGQAYSFIMQYAESNGYIVTGLARECYVDGIWNKDDVADWLTEIQLPIK